MTVEEKREAVSAFMAESRKVREDHKPSRKNPYYVEPHPDRRRSYDLIGACEEIIVQTVNLPTEWRDIDRKQPSVVKEIAT